MNASDVAPPGPGEPRRPSGGDGAWLLGFLPAFPVLLLVLRVWSLAHKDTETMMLLLQYANPLGLLASLLVVVVWALPALVLVIRVCYLLILVSEAENPRSWLTRIGRRTPAWVSPPAVVLAVLSWQLRFLPCLLMLVLVIVALEVRTRQNRVPGFAIPLVGLALPVAAGILVWIWAAPGVGQALGSGHDPVTAALLVLPAAIAPVLTGRMPVRPTRWLVPLTASGVLVVTPFLLAGAYLDVPVLPRVVVDVGAGPESATPTTGALVSVDDNFTTLLDDRGRIRFIPGPQVQGQVLCTVGQEPPTTTVEVRGWQVEQNVLSWAGPRPLTQARDTRCDNR